MSKSLRTMIAVGLVLAMIMVMSPTAPVFAMSSDVKGHWAETQINDWQDRGLVKGYPDGTFRPDNNISRAEFIALVNRAFGFVREAPSTFPDVAADAWCAPEVARAKAAGYIAGYADGTFGPNNEITRQEVAAILSRVLKLDPTQYADTLGRFQDAAGLPDWSRASVNAIVSDGYMTGYPDQTFQPSRVITRGEVVVVLSRAVGELYNEAGTYGPGEGSRSVAGNVTVTKPDITLSHLVIEGNLYLTEGIGDGHVTLDDVTVKGTTTVAGGGPNSVVLLNSTLGTVVVTVPDGAKVRLVASGTTSVGKVEATSQSKLEESDLTGDGFTEVVIDAPQGTSVELQGDFAKVQVKSPAVKLSVLGGTVTELTMSKEAAGSSLDVAAGSGVTTLTLNTATTVTGQGSIDTAEVNAAGVSLEKSPTKIVLATGLTATVAGATISESTPTGGTTGTTGTTGTGGGGGVYVPPAVPAPAITGYTVAVGTVNSSTKVTFTPASGDSLRVVVQPGAFATPDVGQSAGTTGSAYTSGANINSVVPGNHVGLYEVNAGGGVVKFVDLTLTGAQIAAPAPTYTQTVGSLPGTTRIVCTAGSGDSLKYVNQTGAFTLPAIGADMSGTGTAYTSGADIGAAAGNHIGLYEVDGTGKVVKFSDITLGTGDIGVAAPSISGVTIWTGSVIGATRISYAPSAGNTLGYIKQATAVNPPSVGAEATLYGLTSYTSNADILVSANDHVGLFEIGSSGLVYKFNDYQITSGSIAQAAPAITGQVVAPGTVYASTSVTYTPGALDSLRVVVQSGAFTTPIVGLDASATGTAYTSGANITGVTPSSHVGLYEIDNLGKLVKFVDITLGSGDIAVAAPAITGYVVAPGSVAASTKVTYSPAAGDSLKIVRTGTVTPAAAGQDFSSTGTAYTSGADITGETPGNHIGLYEVDGSNLVVKFVDITLAGTDIAAPTFSGFVVAVGIAAGSTEVTYNPGTGNSLRYVKQSGPFALPGTGEDASAIGSAYTSGSDITGVVAGDHIGLYIVDSSSLVVYFADITLTGAQVAAPDITGYTPAPGTVAHSTTITYTPGAGDSLRLVTQSGAFTRPSAGLDASAIGSAYTSGSDISPVADGDHVGLYEVDGSNLVVKFADITLTWSDIAALSLTGATVSPGTAASSTKIAYTTTNQLYYKAQSGAFTLPAQTSPVPAGTTAYTAGNDITGVASGQHVGLYEVMTGYGVTKFVDITLAGSDVSAAAPPAITGQAVAPGTTYSSTSITYAAGAGDSLRYVKQTGAVTVPPVGSDASAIGNPYTSGNDIIGANVGDHIGLYEVDGTNLVVKFLDITLTGSQVTAPQTSIATLGTGSAAGTTKITYTPAAGNSLRVATQAGAFSLAYVGQDASAIGSAYTSGADIASVSTGDHVGLYEVDGTGKVVTFDDITLAGSDIGAPELTGAVVATGSVAGATKITYTPGAGNSLLYVASANALTRPGIGDTVGGVTFHAYTSGTDITGIIATDHIGLYEVDASSVVVKFTDITLTDADIAAPALGGAMMAPGSTYRSTAITYTPAAGNSLKYVVQSGPFTLPGTNQDMSGTGTAYTSGADITGVSSGYHIGLYEVDATGAVVKFADLTPADLEITAPWLSYSIGAGSVAGATKVTATPNAGDSLEYLVRGSAYTMPYVGQDVSTWGTTPYTSGSDITGVSTGNHIEVYEVDGSGKVVYYADITVADQNIAAPTITGYTVAQGTASGATSITYTPATGCTLEYIIQSGPFTLPGYLQNATSLGGTAYTSGADIPGVTAGQHIGLYEVNGSPAVNAFVDITPTSGQIAP